MRVGLKILIQFRAGKAAFVPGGFVPEETFQAWSEKALANRLQHGYVKWEPVPEGAEPDPVVDIDALDKGGLIEYAKQTFNADLDKRSNIDSLRQQVKAIKQRADLLAAREAQGRAAQAARSGESAAKVGGGSSSASSGPAKVTVGKQPKPAPAPEPVTEPPAPEIPPAGGDQGGAVLDPNAGTVDTGGGGGSPQP